MFQPFVITTADVADPFDPSAGDWFRKALGDHLILLLRGWEETTPEQLVALGSLFGQVQPSLPIDTAHEQNDNVQVLTRSPDAPLGRRTPSSSYWHTDRSFLPEPAKVTILRSVVIPTSGGDTQFANTRLAYSSLPSTLRTSADLHSANHSYARYYQDLQSEIYTDVERKTAELRYSGAYHPLVQADPFCGVRQLYLSELCIDRIEGVPVATSAKLISELHELATNPTNVYTHRWQRDDIVIWNNGGLMHRGQSSEGYRRLERVVIC